MKVRVRYKTARLYEGLNSWLIDFNGDMIWFCPSDVIIHPEDNIVEMEKKLFESVLSGSPITPEETKG